MKQFWLQVFSLVIVSFLGLLFYTGSRNIITIPFLTNSDNPNVKKIRIIDDTTFPEYKQVVKADLKVEIADTADKRTKGLGGRSFLASDSGMLFIFDKPGNYKFWMKNMQIPLDFIWISGDRVVDLLENIAPPQPNQSDQTLPIYGSNQPTDKILEMNTGFVKSKNIKIGDKLKLLQ